MDLPKPTPFSAWLEAECKRLERWPVIVAGSVVATEEPLALIAYGVAQGDFPKSLLVLAPRKPERFAAAAAFIDESHRKFIRRSELAVPGPGNTGGFRCTKRSRLTSLSFCSTALANSPHFINVLTESSSVAPLFIPAVTTFWNLPAFGKVPVFGDSMENFAEIASRFIEAGAAIQVGNPEDAGVELIHLLKDRDKMQRMGDSARRLVETSRGALDRSLNEIEKYLGGTAR